MPEMPDEFHIASLLVQRAPRHAQAVRAAIAGMPGAEVQIEEGAKVVVTVEAARAGAIADMVTAIQLLPGVMSATMVFHHGEQIADDEKEPDDADQRRRTLPA